MAGNARSIVVTLTANVAGYTAGMSRAAAATGQFAARADAAVARHGGSIDKMSKGMAIAGGVIAIGVGAAIKSYADFDKAMSGVRANVEATPKQFEALSQSVRKVGTQYGYTATESAGATEELAKAGLTTADIMGGALTGALTLAAAGGVSAGDAAETAATSMTMFGLKAKDVGHIADVLANGANQSTASVGSLSQALRQGGGVAASFGLSLEDTVATLAMFDQNGLKGSDAGTSLKTMLSSLAKPSKQAQGALDDLGIAAFDAGGKFVGMASLQEQLKTKMAGLTQQQRNQALATIFGSDAMRAANVLFKDTSGFDAWKAGVSKAGTAAENAKTRLNNLSGDFKKFKATLQDALIGSAAGANSPFRGLIQGATSAVAAFAKLPDSIKGTGLAFGVISGGALLAGAGILKMVSIIKEIRSSLIAARGAMAAWSVAAGGTGSIASGLGARISGLGTSFSRMSTGAKIGAGLAVAAIAAIGIALTNTGVEAENFGRSSAQLETDLIKSKGSAAGSAAAFSNLQIALGKDQSLKFGEGLKLATSSMGKFDSSVSGSIRSIFHFGTGAASATDAVRARLKSMGDGLADLVNTGHKVEAAQIFAGFVKQAKEAGVSSKELSALMPAYASALASVAGKSALAAGSTAKLSSAQKTAAADAKAQAAALKSVEDALKSLGQTQLAQSDSAIGYQQAVADGAKAVKENGRNLDITTEKGRANQSALNSLAGATIKWSQDTLTASGSAGQAQAVLDNGRSKYLALAKSMGMPAAAAQALADKLFALPKDVRPSVTVDGVAGAKYSVDALGRLVVSLNGRKITIPVDTPNARQVASVLLAVKGAALAANGKSVTIPTSTPTATATIAKLAGISSSAITANRKSVSIKTSSLTASRTTSLVNTLKSATVSANGKSVTIRTSSPLASSVTGQINKIAGAAISADRKSVTIPTAALNAGGTLGQIQSILNAARSKTMTITTRFVTVGGNVASAQATGGPAGIPGFASGGVDMRRGGAVSGGGTGTSDSVLAQLAVGQVKLSNREHVWTAAEVSSAGGHGAMYAMRRMARNGDIRELIGMPAHAAGGVAGSYAGGGPVDTSSYDPDLSYIMQYYGNAPTWQNQVDAQGKQKSTRAAAAATARALSTARARYAQMLKGTGSGKRHKGPTHAQIVAGQNQINGLLAKQRTQQEAINKANADYSRILKARKMSPGQRFGNAEASTNAVSKQFLADIAKIKARGFGNLAFSLLQQGDADARAIAHSLAGGKYADLKRAATGLDASDKLADQKSKLLDQLDPSRKAAREAEKKAAAAEKKSADIERLKAVRDANAALLALRGANYAMSTASGVMQLPPVNLSPKSLDSIAKAIISGGGRLNHATPVQVNSQLFMDGKAVASGVTTHQITDAGHGALLPGVTV